MVKAVGSILLFAPLVGALLWARARDPFHREWLLLDTSEDARFSAIAVMPDRDGPFPVVVWCHVAGGSLDGDGETLRQFASLGLAAVGFEYDKTNQAGFDAQFAAVLEEIERKPWAAKADQTRNAEREARSIQPATFNLQLGTQTAWIGASLGAQRQLSFLARHPERQPLALVRLNGGMVEELKTSAERGTGSVKLGGSEPATFNLKLATTPPPTPGPSLEGNQQLSTFNLQRSARLSVWMAHGENDEVFPASDARTVAEALRGAGAEVQLDVFPGRGHGFGEDQPLLVRSAAEFCATELKARAPNPDNGRSGHWYLWLPSLLLAAAGLVAWVRRSRLSAAGLKSSTGMRVCAGIAAAVALLLTLAHLLLPLFQVTPARAKIAGHLCVQPESRADFDWLCSRPQGKGCRIGDLLEHTSLAALQRRQFGSALPENQWREFVLSPWMGGVAEDIAWRRELWEWLAPRVRRETETTSAAQIVVRELRRRVSVQAGIADSSIAQAWSSGLVSQTGREPLLCAMLRSVGVPARIAAEGRCQFWSADTWQDTPAPLIP